MPSGRPEKIRTVEVVPARHEKAIRKLEERRDKLLNEITSLNKVKDAEKRLMVLQREISGLEDGKFRIEIEVGDTLRSAKAESDKKIKTIGAAEAALDLKEEVSNKRIADGFDRLRRDSNVLIDRKQEAEVAERKASERIAQVEKQEVEARKILSDATERTQRVDENAVTLRVFESRLNSQSESQRKQDQILKSRDAEIAAKGIQLEATAAVLDDFKDSLDNKAKAISETESIQADLSKDQDRVEEYLKKRGKEVGAAQLKLAKTAADLFKKEKELKNWGSLQDKREALLIKQAGVQKLEAQRLEGARINLEKQAASDAKR